jgi:transcriptional regulator with XRE-family HTH domain
MQREVMKNQPDRTEFGKRVLRARKCAGMSQVALAKAIGCTQENISLAENRAEASGMTVAIARATKVNPVWLADGTGEMSASAPELALGNPCALLVDDLKPSDLVQVLARKMAALTESRRKAIGSLLQSLTDDPAQSDSVALDIGYLMTGQAAVNACQAGPGQRQMMM